MRPDQDLAYLTGAVLSGVSGVLDAWRPDRVIVQGDTTSSFAGALAAFYHRIPVAHVEAGLRTGDIYAPWPEEVNRLLVGRLADLHLRRRRGRARRCCAKGSRPSASSSPAIPGSTPCCGSPRARRPGRAAGASAAMLGGRFAATSAGRRWC